MTYMREGMPRCLCQNLLRIETERAKGRCIECDIQDVLSATTLQGMPALVQPDFTVLFQHWGQITHEEVSQHSLLKIAQLALRTLKIEEEAYVWYALLHQTPLAAFSPASAPLSHAETLCTVQDGIIQAFTQWIHIAHSLWQLLQAEPENTRYQTLHHHALTHYQRLIAHYQTLTDEIAAYCKQHALTLRITLLDVYAESPKRGRAHLPQYGQEPARPTEVHQNSEQIASNTNGL